MAVTFPTSPHGATAPGAPIRAEACCCEHGPLLDAGTGWCVRCGRFTREVIDATWRARARRRAKDRAHAPR